MAIPLRFYTEIFDHGPGIPDPTTRWEVTVKVSHPNGAKTLVSECAEAVGDAIAKAITSLIRGNRWDDKTERMVVYDDLNANHQLIFAPPPGFPESFELHWIPRERAVKPHYS